MRVPSQPQLLAQKRKTTRGDDEHEPADYEYYEDYLADEGEDKKREGEKAKKEEDRRVTASLAGWRMQLLRNRYYNCVIRWTNQGTEYCTNVIRRGSTLDRHSRDPGLSPGWAKVLPQPLYGHLPKISISYFFKFTSVHVRVQGGDSIVFYAPEKWTEK